MDKRGIKGVFIVGGMVAAICIMLIFSITIMGDSSDKKVSDLLAAGNKYFSEMEYEQAIVAFMEALEIDPKCEEAYLALAEVYVTVEDYEAAYDILSQGIEQTEAEELIVCLEEIQEKYTVSETVNDVSQEVSGRSKEEISKEENKDDTNKDRTETVYNDDGTYHVDEYDASGNCVKTVYYDGGAGNTIEIKFDGKDDIITKWTQTCTFSLEGSTDDDVAAWEVAVEHMKSDYSKYSNVEYNGIVDGNSLVEVIIIDMTDKDGVQKLVDAGLLTVEGNAGEVSIKQTVEKFKSKGYIVKE